MKTIRTIAGGLFILGTFITLLNLLHAQESEPPAQPPEDVSGLSDYEIQLRAIELATPLDATNAPEYGTFYSAQNPDWAPLPANLRHVPVWPAGDNFFLLDDRQVDYGSSLTFSLNGHGGMNMSLNSIDPNDPGDGGDGDTNAIPYGSTYAPLVIGTNLFIAQASIGAAYLNGIATNTFADVQYEIQSITNIAQTNWFSEGFIWGSQATNWTPLSVARGTRTNLFIRLRSWEDDGSGLPIWWQLQYFGHTGVDPNDNPAGDGWSNIQKFQNGWNPNVFYTPAAPQGLTVAYNANTEVATMRWQPAAGAVTGYALKDSAGNTYSLGSSVHTHSVNVPNVPNRDPNYGDPTLSKTFQIQATYSGGNSTLSTPVPVEVDTISAQLIVSPGNGVYLAASGIPANALTLYLKLADHIHDSVGDTSHDVTHVIPISSVANGLFLLPDSWQLPNYNASQSFYLQSSNADGSLSAGALVYNFSGSTGERPPPFYDGRVQLKQNLIFQYRIADPVTPFGFTLYTWNPDIGITSQALVQNSSNYVYSSFYDINNFNLIYGEDENLPRLNIYRPFEDNELYQNFVCNSSNVDANGQMTTGVQVDGRGLGDGANLTLELNPTYLPSTNSVSLSPGLGTTQTQWLSVFPLIPDFFGDYGFTYELEDEGIYWTLSATTRNYWGLPFLTTKIYYSLDESNVLNSVFNAGTPFLAPYPIASYLETAQPEFQTVEYDFWQPNINQNVPVIPGCNEFSVTNKSDLIIAGLGGYVPKILAYRKVSLLNGYSDSFGYLQQYLDKAYKLDANGNVTTNLTGVVSPYGSFFATDAGTAALLTMADPDTSERGTGIVYCVSLALDKNHDGKIDLSFIGSDKTSANDPEQVWLNNNYDRWHTVDGSDSEQDDLGAKDRAKLPSYQQVPDCNYTSASFQPAIPSTRDLQDYFRLWTPGVAALMKVLPSNYTVRLALAGSGQVRVFQAVETDGGTNYLFNATTASNQVANSASLYMGLLTASSPIVFNIQTNFNEHFIFCGALAGNVQIDLQIFDGDQNLIADAPAYLKINDIKQMYERFTVGDNPNVAPATVAANATDGLPYATPAFNYASSQDTNTPYMLFIHGWNMEAWEKDRYAEVVFKRLYWQGYQGRFGIYRWPTGNKFGDSYSDVLTDARNYDNSEFTAWRSATALTNLLTKLNAEYSDNVYLLAHSMGNVVAGEALRRAGSQLVNTYVAMQGAVPSHAYDPAATNRAIIPVLGLGGDDGTPNRYAEYYTTGAPCYFANSAGAGTYVNVYNAKDYALAASLWQLNQNLKPDNGTPFPGYHYSSSSGFYRINGSIVTYLNFPTNTYEIFAYGDEARCYAIGAQANVGGVFDGNQVDSQTTWPTDTHPQSSGPYSAHVWHSAEFRSDNASRALFWSTVLGTSGFKLK